MDVNVDFTLSNHNIFFNNFTSKVSYFGLTKVAFNGWHLVSLTAWEAIRYKAPKLFYKNSGGISNKDNIYSFGVMLMEIVGRSEFLNATIQIKLIFHHGFMIDLKKRRM